MRFATALSLCIVLLAGVAQAAPDTERVTLPNGLTVVAVHDSSSAVAAFHLAVRVDPLRLPDGRVGTSALSQQVAQLGLKDLYKQQPWVTLGEDVVNTRASFSLNTEVDYCEVRAQVPGAALPEALKLAAQVQFSRPPCTPEQVAAAKDILSNAVADACENVVESTYYRFLRAYHGNQSPLAQPVEGTPETLMALSATDVNSFRATFIGPNNASLCVIGPQPLQQLLTFAREAFGAAAKASATLPKFTPPMPPAEPRISVASLEKWRGVSLMVGLPVPTYGTRDYLRGQLIYTLLDGPHGRLQGDQELAGGFGLNQLMNRKDDEPMLTVLPPMATPQPFLIVHMMTIPRLMEAARGAILGHLLALATRPAEAAELAAAKERLINAYAMMQLSRLNMAKSVNCYELYGQDYKAAWEADKTINAITPEELVTMAKPWLTTHAVGLIMPGEDQQD